MDKHRWAKEIKAWADGEEVEYRMQTGHDEWSEWEDVTKQYGLTWYKEGAEYRIKPQPKEPQYLYVYLTEKCDYVLDEAELPYIDTKGKAWDYVGKIKLEQDDE